MPSSDGQSVCGKVPIINDNIANEGIEPFSVRITSVSNPRIRIGQNAETCVNIIDDDGMREACISLRTRVLLLFIVIPVPVISWNDREVDIPEGGDRRVCFSSDIGTAQSYNVMVGARQKGSSPATRGM